MPLSTTRELLSDAAAAEIGLAAFNVITLEYAEGIVAGAQRVGRPVVLQLSQNATAFHGGDPRPIAAAMRALAEASDVPVALHLDHVEDSALLRRCAEAGFGSVMFDAGRLPYEANVSATREAADWAHRHGAVDRGRAWVRRRQGQSGPERPRGRGADRSGPGGGVRGGHRC